MNAIERLEELERKVEAERQARREMHGIGYDDDGDEIDIDLTPPADLADCPYYRGEGTCQSGCSSEPSCITDRPEEGWPSERARLLQEARRELEATRQRAEELEANNQRLQQSLAFHERSDKVTVDPEYYSGLEARAERAERVEAERDALVRVLGRVEAWTVHWKAEARSQLRDTMKLIHDEVTTLRKDLGLDYGQIRAAITRDQDRAALAAAPGDHRWSGWPGAWCLDCGVEDAREACLAKGHDEGCKLCANQPCPEPGSNRHNPYKAAAPDAGDAGALAVRMYGPALTKLAQSDTTVSSTGQPEVAAPGELAQPRVDGKPFRCTCGSNVFRRAGDRYTCNACGVKYLGLPRVFPPVAAPGEEGGE